MRATYPALTWGLLIFPIALALLGLATIELVFQESLSLHALLPGMAFGLGLLAAQASLSLWPATRWGATTSRPDPYLLPLAGLLTALGLVMARRLAPDLLWAQTTWAIMGLGVMVMAAFLFPQSRPERLRRYKYTWAGLGLILVLLTLFLGVAPSGSGPRLWLSLGDLYFQPSELLKVLLVVFFAGYLAEKRELLTQVSTRLGPLRLPPLAYVGPLLVMWGLSMALLVWQRDLGTALLFLGIFLAMLYVTSGRLAYVIGGLLLFLAGAAVAYLIFDHVRVRADIWLNPWARSQGDGYQVVQGLIALAAGGLFGTGLGRGYPGYIPFVHTDYVFAALGEELGLAGLIALLALYTLVVGRGFRLALRTPQPFPALLAAGLTSVLGLQTLIIAAGVLRLIPLTGITLPFVSYGGSSLVTSYLTVGLLLRLSAEDHPPLPLAGGGAGGEGRTTRIRRLASFTLLGFLVLAAALPYWQVWHARGLLARPDNPRRVEALRRTERGRILDAHGAVLAYTDFDDAGLTRRVYPYPALATTIGYASWHHGSAGLERALDDVLMGRQRPMTGDRFWAGIVGRPPAGEDAAVTLDLDLQRLADESLGDRAGVILILDATDGRVLALASHPTYDPNRLDQDWDDLGADRRRPLLNRATEGLYPPGPLLQVVTLAAALDAGLPISSAPPGGIEGGSTLLVGETILRCPDHARHTDLAAALADGCPVTFARLGLELGTTRWSAAARRLGLGTRTPFELPTLAGRLAPLDAALDDPATLARAAAGENAAVTPLQMARLLLALTGAGQPHLVPANQTPTPPAVSPTTAVALRHLLAQATARQGVLTASDAAGLFATAPTPAGAAPDAWFVGLFPLSPPYEGDAHARGAPCETKMFPLDRQIQRPGGGSGDPPRTEVIFEGGRPADSPRYVIVILVEQAGPADEVVGPMARRILSALAQRL